MERLTGVVVTDLAEHLNGRPVAPLGQCHHRVVRLRRAHPAQRVHAVLLHEIRVKVIKRHENPLGIVLVFGDADDAEFGREVLAVRRLKPVVEPLGRKLLDNSKIVPHLRVLEPLGKRVSRLKQLSDGRGVRVSVEACVADGRRDRVQRVGVRRRERVVVTDGDRFPERLRDRLNEPVDGLGSLVFSRLRPLGIGQRRPGRLDVVDHVLGIGASLCLHLVA